MPNILSLAAARSSRHVGDLIRTEQTQDCISDGRPKTANARFLQFPKRAHAHAANAKHVSDSTALKERVSSDEWHLAFGKRLREVRIRREISEKDAAEAAGRSVETWRNYERSGRGRSLAFYVARFARRFGISLDDLIKDPN